MSLNVTQQSFDNFGFRSSTQPTPVLFFSLNPSLLGFKPTELVKKVLMERINAKVIKYMLEQFL
ncbi:MAG: hypothetical protein V7K32_14595 [Nostoc sp.]|uniref:hypothetical protein n=1 Tax=Nostoc sp. TaxID=1180 RepID=UPI002FF68D25